MPIKIMKGYPNPALICSCCKKPQILAIPSDIEDTLKEIDEFASAHSGCISAESMSNAVVVTPTEPEPLEADPEPEEEAGEPDDEVEEDADMEETPKPSSEPLPEPELELEPRKPRRARFPGALPTGEGDE